MYHWLPSSWIDDWTMLQDAWQQQVQEPILTWWSNVVLQSNWWLPVMAVLLVFWPLLLSCAMLFVTAGTWMFWLTTSMLLGVVQMIYAVYHYTMIGVDICGLSVLKSYAVVRNLFLHYLWDRLPWNIVVSDDRAARPKSRRRYWRQCLEQAGTYENFLKIRIRPKPIPESGSSASSSSSNLNGSVLQSPSASDSALPRCEESSNGSPTSLSNGSTTKRRLSRNGSFLSSLLTPSTHDTTTSPSNHKQIDVDPVVAQELGESTAQLLAQTTARLEHARLALIQHDNNGTSHSNNNQHEAATAAAKHFYYLLSSVVKRNYLSLDDWAVENARRIADCGEYGLTHASRQATRAYYKQVEEALDWLADAPAAEPQVVADRLTLVRKMKQNVGKTALMLSGGGAQAMYHSGLIRALIESKLYQDIKVVSGTSGGSILAAMCAIKTQEELYEHVCVPNVSTDYMSNGEMKRQNIRWFPKPYQMATYWLKNKLLVDSAEFRRTCEFYYGSITFEEAYERTGKHVCITVSASRASGRSAQRLLLNHISTPHVTIASAVAASCALPGVMAPTKLISKDSHGELEPFEVDGVEWIDGSVQADLPFQRIATLFAVSSFIVSQTNFHIVPLLNKAHHPSQKSLYWRLFQTMEWDIRSRVLKLSRLGLFPQFFGQDISKVFKQRYYGNLTIVPRFTTMQTVGLKVLANPTVAEMEGYLKYGQLAAWPHLNAIRDMIRMERALEDCSNRLEERLRTSGYVDWYDDVDSIASSSAALQSTSKVVRIIGRPSECSLANTHPNSVGDSDSVKRLQQENDRLKQQLLEMQQALAAAQQQQTTDGPKKKDDEEGPLWNLMDHLKPKKA